LELTFFFLLLDRVSWSETIAIAENNSNASTMPTINSSTNGRLGWTLIGYGINTDGTQNTQFPIYKCVQCNRMKDISTIETAQHEPQCSFLLAEQMTNFHDGVITHSRTHSPGISHRPPISTSTPMAHRTGMVMTDTRSGTPIVCRTITPMSNSSRGHTNRSDSNQSMNYSSQMQSNMGICNTGNSDMAMSVPYSANAVSNNTGSMQSNSMNSLGYIAEEDSTTSSSLMTPTTIPATMSASITAQDDIFLNSKTNASTPTISPLMSTTKQYQDSPSESLNQLFRDSKPAMDMPVNVELNMKSMQANDLVQAQAQEQPEWMVDVSAFSTNENGSVSLF